MRPLIPTLLLLLPLGACHAATKPRTAAPVRITSPEQTVQIKLRDLLGLLPKGDEGVKELLARLTAIEAHLAAIEALLKGGTIPPAPIPLPAPVPVTGTRK